MIDGLLQNPDIRTYALPFAVAAVLAALLRIGLGRRFGTACASVAAPVGFLVAHHLGAGPVWPPSAMLHKVPYLVVVGFLIGLFLAPLRPGRWTLFAIGLLYSAAALYWLAEPSLQRVPGGDAGDLPVLGGLFAAAAVVMWTLIRAEDTSGLDDGERNRGTVHAPILLIVSAFAAAAVGAAGGAFGMAEASTVWGAALGGYLLVIYLIYLATGYAARFGPVGVLGAGGGWLSCVFAMVLYGPAVNPALLAALLLVFVLDAVARTLRLASFGLGRLLNPAGYAIVVGLPALGVAAWVAYAG